MIPRLQPLIGWKELAATFLAGDPGAVRGFERDFAKEMGLADAFSFRYGRTALAAFFEAMGIRGATVVVQAYTCSVVGHAIVVSGNIPKFVDVSLTDYNQDLDQFEAAIDEKTRAVVATHLFGCPANVDRIQEIVERKAAEYGHRIFVIQDLAHAFVPEWEGRSVAREPDVALWGLGISKLITSVFGGMIGTNDRDIARALTEVQQRTTHRPNGANSLQRRAYVLAAGIALSRPVYSSVRWLDDNTPLLARFTKAYHLDDKIRLPADAYTALTPFEAEVGRIQLRRLSDVVEARRSLARFYFDELRGIDDIVLPPNREGSTFSHFAVRVPDRERYIAGGLAKGVHFGQVIDYTIPGFSSYAAYRAGRTFPNSDLCAATMINLPIHAGIRRSDAVNVVTALREIARGRA